MSDSELYKELGVLTKDNTKWKESIPYISSLLTHESVKIQAKALWLLGEMGLAYPQSMQDAIPSIASFCNSNDPLLRERAVNALGRIGRGDYQALTKFRAKGLLEFSRFQLVLPKKNTPSHKGDRTRILSPYLLAGCTHNDDVTGVSLRAQMQVLSYSSRSFLMLLRKRFAFS